MVAKSGSHHIRIAPLRWRGGHRRALGGWRHISPKEGEVLTHEMLRRPGGERNPPAGLEHSQHLGGRDLRTRREHVAELAQHHVEGGVRIRKGFRVSLDEFDFDTGDRRILPRPLKQDRREVETLHAGPMPRRGDSHNTRAAADVENRLAPLNFSERDKFRRRESCETLVRREPRPDLPLLGLEMLKGFRCNRFAAHRIPHD